MPAVGDHDHLGALVRLGQLLGSSLDLEAILGLSIRQIVDFVRADRGFILLVAGPSHEFTGCATEGIDRLELEDALTGRDPRNRAQVSRSIVERVLRERRPTVSTNATEDPRFQANLSVRLSNVRSVLCVPLLYQEETLGAVYVDNRVASGVFSERDEEMVAAFAQQAAIAIRNAGLYAELRGSLEEKLRLQEELHAKESERRALEEANRSRSELMEYVSHELRNPLTAILGFAQTLRSEAESLTSAERSEFTEAVETEASRMLVMINELLDSARIDAGRELSLSIRSIDPAPILRRAARSIVHSRHWTTAHRLSLNIEHDLGEIDADADKLQQILDNLLSNAVKYSPDGGDIRLACCRTEAGIEIEVSDQGIGMNAEQLGRLFQRFERSEEAALKRIAGTGLGLFLTKHLVELHRGRISCMSDPGKGSTFRVALPARTVNPPSG